MAERICTAEGCIRKHYGRGLCRFHYDQERNAGRLERHERTLGPRGVCAVDDCGELWHSHGFCDTHYARWKKYGDPLYVGPRGGRWNGTERLRSAAACWCGDAVFARDLCRRHWRQVREPEREAVTADRECKQCGRVLPVTEFYMRGDGLPDVVCGACIRLNVKGRRRGRRERMGEREFRQHEREKRAKARAADPARYNRYASDYRARKLSAPVFDFTVAQWHSIRDAYDRRCAYCGCKPRRLTQDHVIPLSRGGGDTASNIVPCCQPCNSSKKDKTVEEWVAVGGRWPDLEPHPFIDVLA